MKAKPAAVLAIAIALMVGVAATQTTSGDLPATRRNAARDTVGCLDTLRASDSVLAVVKMSVESQDKKTKLPADFEGMFAQEFKSRFRVPPTLPLSVMRGSAPCDTAQKTCASGVMVMGLGRTRLRSQMAPLRGSALSICRLPQCSPTQFGQSCSS